ncbi:MAG: heme ABC transporter permease [Sphingomonadaceae bacterium]|nr:heme ABC transporter permease [Sphingomonadaceae bacterium]
MHRYANPTRFLSIARRWTDPLLVAGLVLTAGALAWGLFVAPPDYLQGQLVRIIYIHVPAAWLGVGAYTSLAIASAAGLVWRHPLAFVAARAIAPVGAFFAAVCLLTGSIWGRPAWGTWWEWDARLTSMLILFFLYLAVMAMQTAYDSRERSERAAAILALVGAVNVPIIKFSVEWWNTLHQGNSISVFTGTTIAGPILYPLLASILGHSLLFGAVVLMRMRSELATTRASARARRFAEALA